MVKRNIPGYWQHVPTMLIIKYKVDGCHLTYKKTITFAAKTKSRLIY